MTIFLRVLTLALTLTIPMWSHAVTTEIGINFSRKKTSFDSDNWVDSQSTTGSVSLYFWERVALEMSYTSALAVREEKLISGGVVTSQRTVVQTTNVYGADLIWVLADRRAFFQPYLKGGGARLTRAQEVKINSLEPILLEPESVVVPSYGVGFKVALTEKMGLKVSYDAYQTPVGEGQVTQDASMRVGLSWML